MLVSIGIEEGFEGFLISLYGLVDYPGNEQGSYWDVFCTSILTSSITFPVIDYQQMELCTRRWRPLQHVELVL
jgi:hypothetical protein